MDMLVAIGAQAQRRASNGERQGQTNRDMRRLGPEKANGYGILWRPSRWLLVAIEEPKITELEVCVGQRWK